MIAYKVFRSRFDGALLSATDLGRRCMKGAGFEVGNVYDAPFGGFFVFLSKTSAETWVASYLYSEKYSILPVRATKRVRLPRSNVACLETAYNCKRLWKGNYRPPKNSAFPPGTATFKTIEIC